MFHRLMIQKIRKDLERFMKDTFVSPFSRVVYPRLLITYFRMKNKMGEAHLKKIRIILSKKRWKSFFKLYVRINSLIYYPELFPVS